MVFLAFLENTKKISIYLTKINKKNMFYCTVFMILVFLALLENWKKKLSIYLMKINKKIYESESDMTLDRKFIY